jgi:poly(hydroxyalkanoate) depolymerase family esterase
MKRNLALVAAHARDCSPLIHQSQLSRTSLRERGQPSALTFHLPLVIVQRSNDVAAIALHTASSAPGRQDKGGFMRKISDTIARLAALRARQGVPAPDGISSGRLSTLSNFGSNPGALQAQFYLPDVLSEDAPLVVVLHGCTQTAAGYDYMSGWSQLADAAGFALLYPEQRRENNANLCFNWFLPSDTTRDRGETLSIRQMIEAMIVAHGLDRKRVFVTGLSAGGAMAAALLANYPEVFAGGGIIAGLPYGSATTIPEAFDRMRGHGSPPEQDLQRLLQSASPHNGPWPTISIWQGSADHTVAPSNAIAVASQWRGVHGAEKAPAHQATAGRLSKQVWHDHTGNVAIEINTIAGMGHGTPLDDKLGAPGPYMINVGISSTQEIARFWGISATNESASARSFEVAAAGEQPLPYSHPGQQRDRSNTVDIPKTQKIIEDALRAAGLLR